MESELQLEKMYRLPWTKEDNPNGWIEVTTFCQLKCPGCYRGLAEKNPQRLHEDLEKMKSEIDYLIENRNIQTISIAGGEPLLYPKLKEVVKYAYSKGLKVKIFTNGVLLTEEKIKEFRDVGTTEFVVHVDKYQKRPDMKDDDGPNKLRLKFCEMFRNVGGINLGFILPVSGDDYTDLSDAIKLCKENSDVINLLVLSPYKDILTNEDKTFEQNNLQNPNISKLSNFLSEEFKSKPCAFLGKIHSKDQPSWIFMVPVFYKNKVVGYLDSLLYKKFQERYRKKKGKYNILVKGNKINAKSLLPLAFKKNVSDILFNYRKELKNDIGEKDTLRYQVILIIDGPDKVNSKWNLCDGCPDAMLHDGKLVPSCLLERVKTGEEILVQ